MYSHWSTYPTLIPSSTSVGARFLWRLTTNLANCLTLIIYLGSSLSGLIIFVQRATCRELQQCIKRVPSLPTMSWQHDKGILSETTQLNTTLNSRPRQQLCSWTMPLLMADVRYLGSTLAMLCNSTILTIS